MTEHSIPNTSPIQCDSVFIEKIYQNRELGFFKDSLEKNKTRFAQLFAILYKDIGMNNWNGFLEFKENFKVKYQYKFVGAKSYDEMSRIAYQIAIEEMEMEINVKNEKGQKYRNPLFLLLIHKYLKDANPYKDQ